MKIIFRILVTALALLVCATVVPGISVSNLTVALVAEIVLGLLNLIARPILIVVTLPITLLTLGLFMFVINAALFLLAAELVSGFSVEGFIPALIGSFLVSTVSAIGNRFIA